MADEMIETPETADAPAANPPPAMPQDSVLAAADTTAAATADDAAGPQPVTYEDFKLPEGAAVDGETLDRARSLFSEAGLPQEQAQKFIDLAVSREQAAAQKGVQAFVDLQNKWVSEIKADPEIGGDRMTASMASAARAIDRLGVPGLKEALNLTGPGNNPAIVKAFVRLGQMVSEDRFVPGRNAAPPAPRSAAETIYDGNPKQSQ
jgi:hypothetical protein